MTLFTWNMYLFPIVNSESYLLEELFAITHGIHSMDDLFSFCDMETNHVTTKISLTMKTTYFFSSFKINIGFCEGDEAAIPTGGVKPTFTERPVSFFSILLHLFD